MPQIAPYGSWASPIDVSTVADHDWRPGWVAFDGEYLWWVRPMPAEGGRVALLRARRGRAGDLGAAGEVVLPPPWNVRSRVHEYGGRSYLPVPGASGAAVVFSEFSDQRLYWFEPGTDSSPRPLTPEPQRPVGLRYIEPVLSPDARSVWCVREEHTGPAPTDVRRSIVAVPLDASAADDPSAVRELVADRHFLACPRPSPDGRRLAWIGWDHPAMPWDSTELRVAPVDSHGEVGAPVTVAGGGEASVAQAEWESPDSLLLAVDTSGWWNLHRVGLDAEGGADGPPVNLCPRDEEFAGPLWQPGMQWFAPLPDATVAVVHGRASTRLGILDTATGELDDPADDPFTEWAATLAVVDGTPVGVAAAPDRPFQLATAGGSRVPNGGDDADGAGYDGAVLPVPQARTFAGPGGREVHANVHPPRHDGFVAPEGELPPYVVFVHGGPTGRVPMVRDLEVAFFTSRGIGVVEVNYGGSAGHGREYRNRLRENWGVVDVEDCVAVANALADEGVADTRRLAIRGGSAGGWTSAAALAFSDVFACAVIMYPVLDLAAFRNGETHDFESQYLESLVGPWPQMADRYRDRSPINVPERITAPFLLLQGLEDEVCPPAATERFVERVAELGVPHAYLAFEGEQHGFRRQETIVAALQAELALYARVFGFTPADDLPEFTLAPGVS